METSKSTAKQERRKRQILSATLRLLRRHGTGISTAQIAAEAHCSKETLYNWFEDRDGIFQALIDAQAQAMGEALEKAFAADTSGDFQTKLQHHCVALLDIMTGEAVIAVNRAAMAEACRDRAGLGLSVLDDWNAHVEVPFLDVLEEGVEAGAVKLDDPEEALDVLFGLLVGDKQRRLLLGEESRPDAEAMTVIAEKAVSRWMKLYG